MGENADQRADPATERAAGKPAPWVTSGWTGFDDDAALHLRLPDDRDGIAAGYRAAIEAACDAIGATAPNPPVGCAILDADDRLLAVAAHQRAGTPHAEALALQRLRASGLAERAATLLVTLEPCNHTGRTPPCTEAILASGIRTVWIGTPDPNPDVAGHGAERLQQAGLVLHRPAPGSPIEVACRALIAPFRRRVLDRRPWITVKQALDPAGSMIPPPGDRTFTSLASLRLAHRLRRATDAIVTGTGTILADDPAFTVRHLDDHPARHPRLLAVVGQAAHLPAAFVSAATARGFDVHRVDDPAGLLPMLAEAGVLWAMVEAGPRLLAGLQAAGLWDDWLTIVRPADPDAADRLSVTLSANRPSADRLSDDAGGDVSPLSLLPELSGLPIALAAEPPCPVP